MNLVGSRTQISVSYASAFLVPGWQLLTLCLYAGPVAWIMLFLIRQLDISLYDPCLCMCRQLLAFNPAVHQTTSGEGEMYSLPPYFRLILTFSYCLCEFLREQELGTGRSPDTDKADSFKGPIRLSRLNDFAPDIQDAMEVWALRPHAILVKVISVCRVHVFFHQYVADLREERSENVLRTVSASPFIFDMTVVLLE